MTVERTMHDAATRLELEPITTLDTAEQAVLALVNSIRRTELDAGDRLPNLPELSMSLGVARDNVRRALHALAAEGVVEIKPGRYGGTVMNDRSGIPRVLAPILSRSLLADGVWEELVQVRQLLQTEAALLIMQRDEPEAIARMERHLDDMRRHIDEHAYARAVYDGIEIACAIAVHCGNQVLGNMLLRVVDCISVVAVISKARIDAWPDIALHTLDAQTRLVAAIRERDGEGAARAVRDQMGHTLKAALATRSTAVL